MVVFGHENYNLLVYKSLPSVDFGHEHNGNVLCKQRESTLISTHFFLINAWSHTLKKFLKNG